HDALPARPAAIWFLSLDGVGEFVSDPQPAAFRIAGQRFDVAHSFVVVLAVEAHFNDAAVGPGWRETQAAPPVACGEERAVAQGVESGSAMKVAARAAQLPCPEKL